MDSPFPVDRAPAFGLLLALGIGLLVGLDRERRKRQGADRSAAGIRSFALVSVAGALARVLADPWLVAAGAALVAGLAIVSHLKSRSDDPGMTTELALFVTYLNGVLVIVDPPLGAACGVALAALLYARNRLHRFATEVLSEQELHDGLLLCVAALIVFPLVPAGPQAALGGIDLRPLAGIVVLILTTQAASHVAVRVLGPRFGLPLAGFLAGFASSTAAIATLGRQAAVRPADARALAVAAACSTAATWVLVTPMAAAVSPAAAQSLARIAGSGLCGAALVCGWLIFAGLRASPGAASSASNGHSLARRAAIRLPEAAALAVMLLLVTLGASAVQRAFGSAGLLAGVALAGIADGHAPVASLASLHAAGRLPVAELQIGVLVALSANSASRAVVALSVGGRQVGATVGAALAGGLVAAWSAWRWWG